MQILPVIDVNISNTLFMILPMSCTQDYEYSCNTPYKIHNACKFVIII